jgi:hypothetical protein
VICNFLARSDPLGSRLIGRGLKRKRHATPGINPLENATCRMPSFVCHVSQIKKYRLEKEATYIQPSYIKQFICQPRRRGISFLRGKALEPLENMIFILEAIDDSPKVKRLWLKISAQLNSRGLQIVVSFIFWFFYNAF